LAGCWLLIVWYAISFPWNGMVTPSWQKQFALADPEKFAQQILEQNSRSLERRCPIAKASNEVVEILSEHWQVFAPGCACLPPLSDWMHTEPESQIRLHPPSNHSFSTSTEFTTLHCSSSSVCGAIAVLLALILSGSPRWWLASTFERRFSLFPCVG
jgi:hypothetical protein